MEGSRVLMAKEKAQNFILSRVGKRYKDACFDNALGNSAIEYIRKLKRHGSLLVLQGNPGCGKTYASVCWMRSEIEHSLSRNGVSEEKKFYLTASQFERIFCQPGYWDESLKDMWLDLLRAKWVVLDDLGTENQSNQRFKQKFHEFFDYRYRYEKTLIILTNGRIERYGERIVSRIRDWGCGLYRKKICERGTAIRGQRRMETTNTHNLPFLDPPLMTVSELAAFLSVSRSLVYRWVEENEIPHYRFGKAVRFNATEVKEWLDNQRVEARPQDSKDAQFERDVDKILRSTIIRPRL